MPPVQFVPWRQISQWQCRGCGRCCKDYSVVLNFPEWLAITQVFGTQTTVAGMDRFFIKRQYDGTCSFLCNHAGTYLCSLQNMKPNACKIWPFKVLTEPKYGQPTDATFNYGGKKLYIYADGNCSGLRYGPPTWEFSSLTLKEFAAIALGFCPTQHSSTRNSTSYRVRRL
jgi:Fe-S-cluster containining protein